MGEPAACWLGSVGARGVEQNFGKPARLLDGVVKRRRVGLSLGGLTHWLTRGGVRSVRAPAAAKTRGEEIERLVSVEQTMQARGAATSVPCAP